MGASAASRAGSQTKTRGAGVGQEIGHLCRADRPVFEGQVDRAGQQRAQIAGQPVDRLLDLHRHPVARCDATGHQRPGHPVGLRPQIAIGRDRAVARRGGKRRIRPVAGSCPQGIGKVIDRRHGSPLARGVTPHHGPDTAPLSTDPGAALHFLHAGNGHRPGRLLVLQREAAGRRRPRTGLPREVFQWIVVLSSARARWVPVQPHWRPRPSRRAISPGAWSPPGRRIFPGLGVGAQRLADRITAASGGRLTVQVFSAGELVPPLQSLDAVIDGTAEMSHGAAYYWQNKSRRCRFFTGVPYGMTARELAAWVRYHGRPGDLGRDL